MTDCNIILTTETRGFDMKKTPHQAFVDELHKQMTSDVVQQISLPKNQNGDSDEDVSKEDVMKELERKFAELFGDLDDDN